MTGQHIVCEHLQLYIYIYIYIYIDRQIDIDGKIVQGGQWTRKTDKYLDRQMSDKGSDICDVNCVKDDCASDTKVKVKGVNRYIYSNR